MKCQFCKKDFKLDELDLDGLCFDCANLDPDYDPNSMKLITELVKDSLDSLADAKNTSSEKLKNELVAEYVYKNPEKYINHVVSSVSTSPKNKNKKFENN